MSSSTGQTRKPVPGAAGALAAVEAYKEKLAADKDIKVGNTVHVDAAKFYAMHGIRVSNQAEFRVKSINGENVVLTRAGVEYKFPTAKVTKAHSGLV